METTMAITAMMRAHSMVGEGGWTDMKVTRDERKKKMMGGFAPPVAVVAV